MAVSAGRAFGLPAVLLGTSVVYPDVVISVLPMWISTETGGVAFSPEVIALLAVSVASAHWMAVSTFGAFDSNIDCVLVYR